MNDLQVLVVFSAFFAGGILLALMVFLLDRQDRRAMANELELGHHAHPAE